MWVLVFHRVRLLLHGEYRHHHSIMTITQSTSSVSLEPRQLAQLVNSFQLPAGEPAAVGTADAGTVDLELELDILKVRTPLTKFILTFSFL